MKIALCQTSMKWTIEENVENMVEWINRAAKEGADLAAFTECAVTGYHRKVPELIDAQKLKHAHSKLMEAAMENDVAVIAGSPTIEAETGKVFNSAIYFNPLNKSSHLTSKIGLTDPELRFFTKGSRREVFECNDRTIGIIFCREILDKEELVADFSDRKVDLFLWPSYIKWEGDEQNPDYISEADYLYISDALGVPILNINSANSLNDTALTGAGGSLYLKAGAVAFRGEKDAEMLKIIELQD